MIYVSLITGDREAIFSTEKKKGPIFPIAENIPEKACQPLRSENTDVIIPPITIKTSQKENKPVNLSVSYTHLTLPTKRIV